MVKLAVVGTGRWGRNLVRTLTGMRDAELHVVCDSDADALQTAQEIAPGARALSSFEKVLSGDIDAVLLATPATAHAEMARAALLAGKHVFVEKPLALTLADAVSVTELAEQRGLVLMVGHLMLYHPTVHRLKSLIQAGELGDISDIFATRLNPPSMHQGDAMWTLAPHDISLALYLTEQRPVSVRAHGEPCRRGAGTETVVVDLQFPSVRSQMTLSRVHSEKERKTTVVGSRSTVEFDDVRTTDKLRMRGPGTVKPATQTDSLGEPLEVECRHFINCVRDGIEVATDGRSAVEVIRILEAATQSIADGGNSVQL